jgi:hypothetical protein
LEETEKVKHLSVNIAANGDWGVQAEEIWFLVNNITEAEKERLKCGLFNVPVRLELVTEFLRLELEQVLDLVQHRVM